MGSGSVRGVHEGESCFRSSASESGFQSVAGKQFVVILIRSDAAPFYVQPRSSSSPSSSSFSFSRLKLLRDFWKLGRVFWMCFRYVRVYIYIIYIHIFIYIYVYVYIYMCIYILYIYTHTHKYIPLDLKWASSNSNDEIDKLTKKLQQRDDSILDLMQEELDLAEKLQSQIQLLIQSRESCTKDFLLDCRAEEEKLKEQRSWLSYRRATRQRSKRLKTKARPWRTKEEDSGSVGGRCSTESLRWRKWRKRFRPWENKQRGRQENVENQEEEEDKTVTGFTVGGRWFSSWGCTTVAPLPPPWTSASSLHPHLHLPHLPSCGRLPGSASQCRCVLGRDT